MKPPPVAPTSPPPVDLTMLVQAAGQFTALDLEQMAQRTEREVATLERGLASWESDPPELTIRRRQIELYRSLAGRMREEDAERVIDLDDEALARLVGADEQR